MAVSGQFIGKKLFRFTSTKKLKFREWQDGETIYDF